jgi:hypothetical protein
MWGIRGSATIGETLLNMKLVFRGALVIFASCFVLFSQTQPQSRPLKTFHIEGTIRSEWDDPLHGSVPRTELTFSGKQASKTVTADEKGFYQLNLPVGFYKMTVRDPKIDQPYERVFSVVSPARIMLNEILQDPTVCDGIQLDIDNEQEAIEQKKDSCGGPDYLPVPSKDGTPYVLFIQYFKRQRIHQCRNYFAKKNAQWVVPVFVAYNLFSLEADTVVYDIKSQVIQASGNVVTEDGFGKRQTFDSISFKIKDGRVTPF